SHKHSPKIGGTPPVKSIEAANIRSNMKRSRTPSSNPARAESKYLFGSQGRTLAKPTLRRGLVTLALVGWTISQSGALAANPMSGQTDSNKPQLKVTVWLEKGAHKANVDSKGVILKGYDAVAYFTQNKAVKGNPKYQTNYQGAIYYFSSEADLTAFKKDPS